MTCLSEPLNTTLRSRRMVDYSARVTLGSDNNVITLASSDGSRAEEGAGVGQCQSSLGPIEHLLIAIGSCLLRFACRYLVRRGWNDCPIAEIRCTVDEQACELTGIQVHVTTPCALSAEQQTVFQRTLELCPIHKALKGTVPICISASPADEELTSDWSDTLRSVDA